LTKDTDNYGQIVETIHLPDGPIQKVGFHEGKWVARSDYERVAVAKKGYLIRFEYDGHRRARAYDLYVNFAEMAADDLDVFLLSKVAAALNETDFVAFFD
jgi:hypothetical protein